MAYDTLPPWHEYPRKGSPPRVEHMVHIEESVKNVEESVKNVAIFRWVCSCGDNGSWALYKFIEAGLGARHVRNNA